jgi:hypothetical protein
MDINNFLPWDTYSPLTAERLSIVADKLRKARDGTLELYDPIGGDNPWSHGCRAHVRQKKAVLDGAKEYDWLTILPDEEALRFTFAIGGVPVRFYRGTPEEIPEHHLHRTFAEIRQLQLVLIPEARKIDKVLRMAIELDTEGNASEISLVELDVFGKPLNTYAIPRVVAKSNVIPAQMQAIELPPLQPEPLENMQSNAQKQPQVNKKKTA